MNSITVMPMLHDALTRKTSVIYLIGNVPVAVLAYVQKHYQVYTSENDVIERDVYARVYERLPIPLYSSDDRSLRCIEIFHF